MTPIEPLALSLIKLHEGLRLQVYDDATGKPLRPGMTLQGHPTIGYGRALDVRGITEQEAEALLERDLYTANEIAVEFIGLERWFSINTTRRIVLVEMAHNLGRGGLFRFKRFRAALQTPDYDQAAQQMLDSKWATQVGHRAKRLADMMRTGEVAPDVLAKVETERGTDDERT